MAKSRGNPTGRPPKYKTPEEMQEKIDAYFKDCIGEMLLVDDPDTGEKHPYSDKYGMPIFINARPPTITGLALALGFVTRQALLNYQAKKEFVDTVSRAKTRVEEYAETRLFDKDGANGAKFSLANNFRGWAEKTELAIGNKAGKPFAVATDQDAQKALEALGYAKRA